MLETVLNRGDASSTVGSAILTQGNSVQSTVNSVLNGEHRTLNGRGAIRNDRGVAQQERNAVVNVRSLNTRTMDFNPQPVEPAVRLHLLVVDADTAVRSACAEIAASLGYAVELSLIHI